MAVELKTLRVSAELDASKYTTPAQQKVAADKAMAASGKEAAASITAVSQAAAATETRVSQAGNAMERLSRQFVDGYASAQRAQSAINTLSREIDKQGYDAARVVPILEGIYRKYGQLGDGAQFAARGQTEFAAAISNTTARLQAQEAIAGRTQGTLTRLNRAANTNGGSFNTANIASQFQDIGITAAMGMNPLQIALQQGTQLSMVFESMKASGQDAASALVGAFTSIISPISLVTIGLTAAAAAAIQYFTAWYQGGADSNEEMEKQNQLINTAAQRWGAALPALKAYNDELQKQHDLNALIEAQKIIVGEQYKEPASQIPDLMVDRAAIQTTIQALGTTEDVAAFRKEWNELTDKIEAGTASGKDAYDVINLIDTALLRSSGSMQESIDKLKEWAESIDEASKKAEPFLRNTDPLGMSNAGLRQVLTLQRLTDAERERQRQREENERLGSLVPTPTARPSDLGFAAYEADQEKAREARGVTEDYLRGQRERLEMLRAEIGLVGEVDAVRAGAIRTLEVEQEIRRLGIELYGEEANQMRANAALEVQLTQQLAERRKEVFQERREQIQAMDDVRDGFRDFIGDIHSGIAQGESFWDAFREAGINALNDIADRALDMLTDALFGARGSTDGGILSGLFGGIFGGKSSASSSVASAAASTISFGDLIGAANDNYAKGAITRMPLPAAGSASAYRDAIASIESLGSGGYAAIGPTHPTLGRALGRYQIMEANIGPWSQEALGRTVTPAQFMANPSLQDAIFDQRFGSYVERFGERGAAQAWFGGPGSVGKLGRQDVLGTTVGGYGDKFMAQLEQMGQTTESAAQALDNMATNAVDATKGLGVFGKGTTDFGASLSQAAASGGAGGGGFLSSLFGGIGSLFMGGIGSSIFSGSGAGGIGIASWGGSRIGGFAGGTENAPGGWAWVGEEGPELRKLRPGDVIRSNARSVQMAQAANGNSVNFAPVFNIDAKGSTMTRAEFEGIARQQSQAALEQYQKAQERGGWGSTQKRYASNKG
jgi:hypothetical protein